jgi:hypothetical protein
VVETGRDVFPIRQGCCKVNVFTEREKTLLQLFCRNCDQIKNSRFFEACRKMDHSYKGALKPDGSWEHKSPKYDENDMVTFLTYVRKLLLNDEPNIFRILNILKKGATEEEAAALKQVKRHLKAMGRSFGGITISMGSPGKEEVFPPKRMADIIFNAYIFHSDLHKQREYEMLKSHWPMIQVFFISHLLKLSAQSIRISETVKSRGYVQVEDS